MTDLQNWHDVIMSVERANIDKENFQKKIKRHNKRAYRQQLDREVQIKNKYISIQNELKIKELSEAKRLAEVQKLARIKQRTIKQKVQKIYGQQNINLIHIHKHVKTATQEIQRKNIRQFLQHPFVKLVDQQDNRNNLLRQKFKKQNQINQLQEQIKSKAKNTIRYQQARQRNDFIDYVEKNHQKRSQQRQRFKNKYLRIKKDQIYPNTQSQFTKDLSVQKMYISYLNNQIKSENQRKIQQKKQIIDDARVSKFYSSNTEPDSSPAYLGRNPLNYQRRRQLYYINKHLNTAHQRSFTSNVQLKQKMQRQNDLTRLNSREYSRLANQLNPEEIRSIQKKSHPFNSVAYQNHSESVQIKPLIHSQERQYNFQTNTQRKQDMNQNRQERANYEFFQKNNQPLAQQSNRRIKSQFAQQKSKTVQKIEKSSFPQISKSSFQKPSMKTITQQKYSRLEDNNKIVSQSHKKQYIRYDFITGKQVAYYA